MGRKPKFKPVITRVKLNPEQAVLVGTIVISTAGEIKQHTPYEY